MQTNNIVNIQFQNKEFFLYLFLVLNFFAVLACVLELYYLRKKCNRLETYLNHNTKKITDDFMSVFYSTMLFPYLLQLKKENIMYQIDIPKKRTKKIFVNLNEIEKEDLLFILNQLLESAFKLLKKSKIRHFSFQIFFDVNTVIIQITHSISNSNKNSPFCVKNAFGSYKQFRKIQTILKKHSHFQLFSEVMENFIYHKIQIKKSFSSHKR